MPNPSELERIAQEAAARGEPDFLPAAPTPHSIIQGLMDVAEQAMPDTYFATDSRINAARQWLEENHA